MPPHIEHEYVIAWRQWSISAHCAIEQSWASKPMSQQQNSVHGSDIAIIVIKHSPP